MTATIWRTRDALGREVAFTDVGRAHILSRHPDLADRFDDVRTAIEAPDRVTQDRTYPRRNIFYRRTPSGRRWLRVVVNYGPVPPQATWAGHVITAHFLEDVPSQEVELWP